MSIVLAVTTLTLVPGGAANAVVVQWGTNGGSSPNYETDVNGDFVMAGNGVLACSGTSIQANAGTCANLHTATAPTTTNPNVNDYFQMVNNNSVSGFTTNSSSATLTIPAGATVERAFLNWSANTGTYAGQTGYFCASPTFGAATMPAGAATGYQGRGIQFRVGSNAIQTYTPYSLLEDATTQATARYYSATADVTSAFAGATTGSAVTLSAGNIWAPQGYGCYAGWSVTVIYDYGTYILGNLNSTPHKVIYYEGHVRQGAQDAALTVDYNGFTAVDTGTRAGFTLYEGDRGITGDTASYRRGTDTAFTEIQNSAGATGNFGIGRAAGSVRYTQTSDTSTFTNQSVDVQSQTLSRVVAGDTSVRLQLATSGDSYLLTNSTLSVPTAGLKVEKTYDGTADNQYRTSTERATFTVRLTNTGAGTLTNIAVTDDQTNCARTLTGITLLPLQSTTFTCTATNPSAATYVSTANATATTVSGGYLASGSDSTTVTLTAIALTKSSALAAGGTGRAGDVVTYTFTATNTGGGPLTGVAITDPLSGLSALTYAWPGTAGALAAGQSVTATATRTLTQTDVDAGSVVNSASVTGTDADGGVQPTATAANTHVVTPSGSVAVTKSGAVTSGIGGVGSTITWAIRFTNTGNVTLTNVALTDSLAGLSTPVITWPGTAGRLAPGQAATATATSTVTQAQVNAGVVTNTASVSATTPQGATVSGSSPAASVATVAASPGLSTSKSAAYASGSGAVGSVIRYSFSATNTGNVTLTGVQIADPLSGLSALTYAWPGTSGTLQPGQTVTATATYTVTQADVNRGSVVNRSTASGTTPSGGSTSAQSAQVTTATVAAAPAVTLTKSGSAAGQTAGSVVTYSFTLTNSGNVTLTGAGITDPLTGLSAISYGTWPSGTTGTLQPGQSVTATATYALTQSDVDAGSVVNTATATATPPSGANVTQARSATVPIAPSGALTVVKTGAVTAGTGGVGSTVTWSFTIRNAGNVTLSQIALTDTLAGLSTPVITWPGATGILTPGQTATATATSTITQAQVDAGTISNTATTTGRTPQGTTVTSPTSTATVTPTTAAPAIGVVKTGTVAGGAAGNAGDVIGYSFAVTNTGNTTLTNVTVSDPLSGLSTPTFSAWPGTPGTLAPGQTATATATYTIRQSDVNAGAVANTATANGRAPSGATVGGTSSISTPTAAAAPGVVVTKTGVLAPGATGVAGDTVNWSFTIRNSGNVTLTTVEILERTAGVSARTYTWPGLAGTLQPGQTATATATSTLTQSDVNAGSIVNTAYGRGLPPTGAATTSPDVAATVSLAPRGTLTLTKSPSVSSGVRAGDVITYSFTATNTGNVTLTGTAIADPLAGLSAISYGAWTSGTTGTLQPGQAVNATATYTVSQTDVNRGSITNTATATGRTPQNAAANATSPAVTVTTVAAAPSLTTAKTAQYTTGSGGVGSVITYTFTTRNTGNTTLTGVVVADPLTGLSPVAYGTWPSGTTGTLQPGQEIVATATYTLLQGDVDRGSVANQSTATGTPPTGAALTARSANIVTPTVASAPNAVFTKTGGLVGTGVAGDTVTYSFVYRNTGNVTLTGVAISDPLLPAGVTYGTWPGATGVLAPGQEITASGTKTLTQSDVDAGSVVNTAIAVSQPPTGSPLSRTSSATVPITPSATATFAKSSAYLSGTGGVGSVVRYTFTATNTGNVTLSVVTVSDPLTGLTPISYGTWPSGTTGVLRPGDTVTATADHTVTQTDVDAGSILNRATLSARTPQGAPVSIASNEVTTATAAASPAIFTEKSASVAGGGVVGSVVTYTIRSVNTGNVTLTGVTVSDPSLPAGTLQYGAWPSGTAGTLRPGDAIEVTARHTVTQAEADAGSLTNTASSSGTPPTGPAVSANSPTVVTPLAARTATIGLTHTGTLPAGSPGRVGDVVTFSYTVTNTGNTTLTSVGVAPTLTMQTGPSFPSWPGAPGTLLPGQSATATSTYVLTQADVDAGSISDPATASGIPPAGVTPSPTTATATAIVPMQRTSTVTIAKTGRLGPGENSGQTGTGVLYDFVVRNTGTTTLTDVRISDPLLPAGTITFGTWPTTTGTLLPGEQVTASARHVITLDEFVAGRVNNTAQALATSPTGAISASSGQVTVTTGAQAPGIALDKSGAYTGTVSAGDVGSSILYSFTARNTGNVPLTSVQVTDARVSAGPIPVPGTLGVGESRTVTATYMVTQADVDAGVVVNRASVTATAPGAVTTSAPSPEVRTDTAPAPVLLLDKTVAPIADPVAGATAQFTLTLTNAGNVTLNGVALDDPLVGGAVTIPPGEWAGAVGVLPPGDAVSVTVPYTITQADVDAGSLTNVATANGTPASGGAAVSVTDAASVPLRLVDALELSKTATLADGGVVGDTITYRFEARNTGTTTLTGVAITDPLVGLSALAYENSWSTTSGRLAPGGVVSATATYTITQPVVDAGTLSNTARVDATAPDGDPVADDSNTVTLTNAPDGGLAPAAPALTVTKTASPAAGVQAGDVITYTVRVANTGNTTVSGISVTDPLTSASPLTMGWPGATGVLAPSQVAETTTTHSVTQADVDAGGVVNTASARGTGAGAPGGIPVEADGSVTTPAVAAGPQISVTDAGALEAGGTGVRGDLVDWTYVVTNTGNVTLTGVSVTESLTIVPGSLVYGTWPAASGRLEPGQSVTVTSRTALTQAQVDAGEVTSGVTSRGTPPGGGTAVTATASATVDIPSRTGIDLVKTGVLADGDIGQVGDRVEYTLSAVNTGNVTLYRVDLVDPLEGLVITSLTWPPDADGVVRNAVLPPGQRAFGTGYVILTQEHIDAGFIANQADVAGYTTASAVPGEVAVEALSEEIVVPTITAAPQLTVVTRGDRDGAGIAGDTITWTSTLTNTGNVTIVLDETQFTDAHAYTGAPTYTWNAETPGRLAPGESLTMVGLSTISQSEVDAGAAINAVTGTGAPVRGPASVTSNTATATVPTTSTGAAVDLVKTVAPGPGFTGRVGDPVLITYTLTNTGDLSLTGVAISDTATLTAPGITYEWLVGTTPGTLAPGATVEATATHLLTQAEVDAGTFATPATGVGTAPVAGGSLTVQDVSTDDLPIAAAPDMTVVKAGALEGDGSAGTRILYSFRIQNTGNVTLTLVDLVEQLTGVSDPAFEWPDEDREGVLLPGEVADATAVYTITQADVDAGTVTNLATASGKPPLGDTIYRESNTLVTSVAPAAPAFALSKSATPTTGITAGSTIDYVITASNTGNQTLTGVAVTDLQPDVAPPTPTWPGLDGTLLPGQSATFRTSYVVTQADIDAGGVTNVADATATAPGGTALPASASAFSAAVVGAPAIDVVDSGRLIAGATGVAGDQVEWTYVVSNAGNVTLTGVEVEESLSLVPGSLTYVTWPGATGVLSPGQSVTATARYVVTQTDVDAGTVRSTVEARGTTPTGISPSVVTDGAVADVAIASRPSLAATKTGALPLGVDGEVGDRVEYTLSATNTGNVTLYGGALEDRLPGLVITGIQWPVTQGGAPVVGLLPPGSVVTGQAYVVITQADLDRGFIENTAGVLAYTSSTQQDETTVTRANSNTVVVDMAQSVPQLLSSSSGTANGAGGVGDTITWSHTLTNTGNVSVSVDVADYTDLKGLSDVAYSPAGPTVVLAPGGTLVLTGTSVITQQDVDAGSVVHRAVGAGDAVRDGARVESNVSAATVPTQSGSPAIEITKGVATGAGYDGTAGSPVVWSYTIRNSGNVTLTGVDLTDPLADLPAGVTIEWGALTPGTLPVGATVTASATHALTQAEVDAGRVESAATTTGTPPQGAAVTASATAGLDIASAPSMTLSKQGTTRDGGVVGDIVDYDFVITNTGNVTLTLIDLIDDLAGVTIPEITWPDEDAPGVVLPGETATATATYEITQEDLDRGSIANIAVTSGLPPTGPRVSATSPEEVTPSAPAAPELTVDKSVDATTGVAADQVLTYTITVANTGNVTVTGVDLADLLPDTTPLVPTWPGADGELRPGDVATFTTTYRATQSDVDAGSITNVATATGTAVRGSLEPATDAVTSTTVAAAPGIDVLDSGVLAPGATGIVGDEVLWTYLVTNTGNRTLTDVAVAETGVALVPGSLAYAWPGTPGVLLPGQSATVTARSVLTQEQVDAESATSGVVATGTTPAGVTPATVTDDATATVPVAARPAMAVVKTGQLASGDIGAVGDRIEYTLTATNTGNVTLHRGALVDPLTGLVITGIQWPVIEDGAPVVGLLPPGSSVTGTGYVVVTQTDVDRGFIENIANVAAYRTEAPVAGEVAVTADSNRVVVNTVETAAQLTSSTEGVMADGGVLGDTVTWTHTLTNTGNVTVTLAATDYRDLDGLTDPSYDWSGAATADRLAPGESLVLTGTSRVEQSDVDRGYAAHRAVGTGASVRDAASVTSNTSAAEVPTVTAAPALTVTDSGALVEPGAPATGDLVRWSYRITNTGNVTLTGVSLSDSLPGIGTPSYTWTTPEGVLQPGEFVEVTADYPLTQPDLDAGSVISVVTATGQPPAGAPATASATDTVVLTSSPLIAVDKAATLEVAGAAGVGDWIRYDMVIRNTGNVTLTGITLGDELPGMTVPVITWPGTPGVLAPGAQATATARYQINQPDVDRGFVRNTAVTSGVPPTGPAATAQSAEVETPTEAPEPGIAIVKGGDLYSGSGAAGSTLRFTFSVTNTGNVSLSTIDIDDRLAGVGEPVITYPGGLTSLPPGATATAYADYVLQQADIDRTWVDNVADVDAVAARGDAPSATSNTFRYTTIAAGPAITATQSAAYLGAGTGELDDVIGYTFRIRNTGNVTLTSVEWAATVAGLRNVVTTWPATTGTLAPGQELVVTAEHVVTQEDVDRGFVDNVLSGSGIPPAGARIADAAPMLEFPLAATQPAIAIAKSGAILDEDTVRFSFRLENTGDVTVRGAAIADPLEGLGTIAYDAWPSGVSGELAPGDVVTATADYPLTQDDRDSGSVTNTATASGTAAGGGQVSASAPTVIVPLPDAVPAIEVAKSMSFVDAGTPRAGSVIEYSFTVTNTGDVTLTGVGLTDAQPLLSALVYTWPGEPGVLAPGQSATATARYSLAQADVDAGTLASPVTADGTGVRGGDVSDAADGSLEIARSSGLSLDKTASVRTTPIPGQIIDYRIVATNTGNVTLTDVAVTDDLLDTSTMTATWPGVEGQLLPGASVVLTGAREITVADVAAGAVANVASASASGPAGVDPVIATDGATVQIPNGAAVTIVLRSQIEPGRTGVAGDRVIYAYVVTNTGTVPLSGIEIIHDRTGRGPITFGAWPGAPFTLLPGQSVTASSWYVLTPADIGTTLFDSAVVDAVGASPAQIVTDVDEAALAVGPSPIPTTPPSGDPLPPTGATISLLPIGIAAVLILAGLMLTRPGGRRKENQ